VAGNDWALRDAIGKKSGIQVESEKDPARTERKLENPPARAGVSLVAAAAKTAPAALVRKAEVNIPFL
jgi:hypothetical protein